MEIPENTGKSRQNQLNPHQLQAAKAPANRPLLVVAGAGTGKTKTLTTRIAHFIEEGVPGDQILAVTFTNKAAKEMLERIASSLELLAVSEGSDKGITKSYKLKAKSLPFIGTFHALGAHILRKHAPLVGRSHRFAIFDENDSFTLLKRTLKAMDLKKESPAAMREAIGAIKNGAAIGEVKEKVVEVFEAYEEALRRNDAFDFDDLLSKTVAILKENPNILARYHERFTHILVDEYQDLNDVQYELIRLLASGNASLSVVGDAEQTIYGWRGSNIGIFLSFPDHWPEPLMVTLTQNYRSTEHILGAAGGVIKENVYDTKIERATDLWTEHKGGEKVVIHEAVDEEDEAAWIAGKVSGMQLAGSRGNISGDPLRTAYSQLHTAILYRTNAQSRALEQALLRRHISYRVYGGLKFYERKEIKDVIAGLRLALNPKDEVSGERIEKQFSKRLLRNLLEGFAAFTEREPLIVIGAFLKIANYFEYMDSHLTNPKERRENIEELIRFAGNYTDLSQLLEEVALLQSTDEVKGKSEKVKVRETNDDAAVVLSTIHLAKGLEFDRVFIAGANEGFLPHARSFHTKDEVQEERRLMYVAMTRARRELFISFYGIPSRFIGEIPEEHARFETSSTVGGQVNGKRDEFFGDFEDYEEKFISFD